MGGKGSGGFRVGAGRKPKDATTSALHGSRRGRQRAKSNNQNNQTGQQSSPPAAAETLPPPAAAQTDDDELLTPPGSMAFKAVPTWNEFAPLALAEGTLTKATVRALRDLCEAIVMRDELKREIEDDGYTVLGPQGIKAHPLIAQFRGLMQRIEAGMARFKLAPLGKELPPKDAPEDPFDEFEKPAAAPAAGAMTH